MEDILVNRLSIFIKQIQSLSKQALNLYNNLNNDNIETARILAAKLKSVLSCFKSELYNYFKLCNNPNADEVSNLTTHQLQGEEALAELDEILKLKTERPTTSNVDSEASKYSKLPDLNLPEFSGSLLGWYQFWDQFTSNINRRKLNDVDKLLYLKGCLKGDAARLLDGLDTTNKNFEIAVNTLKARYGKENDIIYAHHRALNKVKQAERMEDCRATLDEIEKHLRVLQSMGEDISSNHIRFLIMEKFPTEIIYETKMKLGADESVTNIRTQLGIIISAKEEAQRMTLESPSGQSSQYTVATLHVKENTQRYKGKRPDSNYNNYSHMKPRRTQWKPNNSYRSNNSKLKQENKPTYKRKFEYKGDEQFRGEKKTRWSCIFCKGEHYNDECDKFKTINERKAKLKGKCYNCFGSGHISSKCNLKKYCPHCRKQGLHNRALCPNKNDKEIKKKESTNVMHANGEGSTVLQTAVVKVKGQSNDTKACRILLDCGSQRSYVTQKVAKKLNLQVVEQNSLSVFTFGSQIPKNLESPLVKLQIETKSKTTRTVFANVVPTISHGVPYPVQKLIDGKFKGKYVLADDGSLSNCVDILIGNGYYYSVMSTRKIHIKEDLYLVESEFGWILSGRSYDKPIEQISALTYFQSSCEVKLNQPDLPLDNGSLIFLWDLESIGITDSPKVNRDEEAIKNFNATTKYKHNRYYVSWPWNEYPPNLPTNYGLAFGRLVSLLKRLNQETLSAYNKTLKEQLEKDIIEIVPTENEGDHPIHYIPHHGVTAPGKPIRIVYDASAKTKDNKSLNECLYCGPLMLEDLTGLIIRFRCHTVGLIADVEKAFLQIGLQEQDRDVARFLWVKDITKPANEENLVHLRFTRVPFGIISSPFILNATVKHHLSKTENESVRKLAHDIYVDNVVTGVNTTKEALNLHRNSKQTFQQISMNLRGWSSNSEDFSCRVPDASPDKVVKVLGLDWHLENDTLHLRTKIVNSPDTKRGILKSVASIFDPCGFTVPTLLSAKLLLQDLWKSKIKWDTSLPKDMLDKWNDIQNDLSEVKEISLPRCYTKNFRNNDCQIHCFADASTRAYAAVVYLVVGNNISFVIGKSRLVPIKDQENLKIPRLELLAVLIGSRLIQYILKHIVNLNIKQQVLWTDSQIVIDWINSNKLLSPFVTRRIDEIKRNRDLTIRHVPSEMNPADAATRPTRSKDDREKWLAGPDFLLKEPNSWPTRSSRTFSLFVGEDAISSETLDITNNETPEELPEPMDMECNTDRDNCSIKSKEEDIELQDSTLREIKKLQAEYFKEEVNGKQTNLSRNLGLFKDVDGILRCKGRHMYAEYSFDKRYPVIIPKVCEFTHKLIKETHEANYHVGVNHTLSLIRQSYWIPEGKRQVQKILRKCPRCLKHGGGPFKLPSPPALPHERVNYSAPFTFTGIDYLGPVLVRTEKGSSKRWICLMTCLAVRAVHLEVVQDLSAEEGLLALRRMVSTRGVPTLITSDNALYFKLIADIVSNPYCIKNKIQWRFIPELAPWFGGFYERLVGLVKHCMRRTLQKHLLNDSQLSTIVKEIEAVINTRPLTCVDAELEHILKPSDFLQIGKCITLNTAQTEPEILGTSTKTNLIQGWRRARVILDEFKEMFCNRYLPSLRERYSHSHKQPRVTSNEIPKEGQIVQIRGDKNRENWKVGKIFSLIKGSDGLCRVAKVKVGDTLYTRSIAHLYPLEVEENEELDPAPQNNEENFLQQMLPKKVSEEVNIIPNSATEETVDAQRETLTTKEKETAEEMDETHDSADVANKETEMIESIQRVEDDLNDANVPNENLMTNAKETVEEQSQEIGHKRIAAVRAREKIREWTRNLLNTLL